MKDFLRRLQHRLNPRAALGDVEVLRRELAELRQRTAPCYLGNNNVLARVQGFKMVLPSDDMALTPHLVMDGHWEMNTTRALLSVIRPGMTVLDIGANVGYFTLLAGRATGPTGKVHAFEPDPRNAWHLTHNVSLAGHLPWTEVVQKGLWHENGTMKLVRSQDSCGGHSMAVAAPAADSGVDVVEVPTIRLDDYLGDERRVDVIKMDAEGAEPYIFDGMPQTLEANPTMRILLEYCPTHLTGVSMDPQAYLQRLEAMGFSLGLIDYDASIKPLTPTTVDQVLGDRPTPVMLMLKRNG